MAKGLDAAVIISLFQKASATIAIMPIFII
jgi:hypothetical protein